MPRVPINNGASQSLFGNIGILCSIIRVYNGNTILQYANNGNATEEQVQESEYVGDIFHEYGSMESMEVWECH